MKQIKYRFVSIFLLPFVFSFELTNLDKLDAESPSSKTREERSPHYSSGFFSGFNGLPYEGGNHQGSHENHQQLDCPFPYKRVGENCYYAMCTSSPALDTLSWNAARTFCQSSIRGGGDLAVFDSPNEYADAVRYIKSLDPTNTLSCDYWIGGYGNVTTVGSSTVNVWNWITGKTMPMGVPYWGYDYSASPILTLRPITSSTLQEVYLKNDDNYFFSQVDTLTITNFPLCQISLEKKHKGYGDSSHKVQHFGFFHDFHPEWRSDHRESFSPQLREFNPFQNTPFKSSQVAPNNQFIRSYGHSQHNHRSRVPYVMNSHQRNLPIPGTFSERKALPDNLPQKSMNNDENRDNHTPPESKDSLLDKTINIEIKEVTILQSARNNDKLINDQKAAQDFIHERAKEYNSETREVPKKVSTVGMDTEMLERKMATDDLTNESESGVNEDIEVDEPGIQIKEELAEINIPVNEEKVKSNEQVESALNIPINEVELIKQDTDTLTDEHTEEFREQNVEMKTSSADTDKADANFNHVIKSEIDNEREPSESKRSEFQSDPLNSYLPGMIYDIVNILQNIDRTYKPRFNIDRT